MPAHRGGGGNREDGGRARKRGAPRPIGAAGEGGLHPVAPPPRIGTDGGDGRGFAHEHHAPLAAPAAQAQGGFDDFPAVPGVLPDGAGSLHLRHEHFDFRGVPQFAQVGPRRRRGNSGGWPMGELGRAFFGGAKQCLISIGAVAAQEGGPVRARQRVEQFP